MRSGLVGVAVLLCVVGCEKGASPPPGGAPSDGGATVDIVFFFDDDTSITRRVSLEKANALDAEVRPLLSSAFAEPPPNPRVVRWLIDDVRGVGVPREVGSDGVKSELRMTVKRYRDYRVAPALGDNPSIRALQHRRSPDDAWEDWAGIPDPEQGLERALGYLANDLKSLHELLGLDPWAS